MTKEHALSEQMSTIYHIISVLVHYILLIFDMKETYTCKYCTGLWISWYEGEIKWGKKNTAKVYQLLYTNKIET